MTSVRKSAPPTLAPDGAGSTDVGRRRRHNEDQVLVSPEVEVFAVADGMGGHQAGDVASQIAATALEDFFWSDRPVDPNIEGIRELSLGAQRLLAAVHHCNEEVFGQSGRSANQGGMGSTMVAIHCATDEQLVHICHVGDSRCYRLRNDELVLLTEDHSMINEALRLNPDLSEEILRQLPSNVVTRALGTKESVRPDIRSEPMVGGDIYLLCSDGLTGEVDDQDLLAALLEAGDEPQRCCDMLINMANEAGGRDNVSAVVVKIDDASGARTSGPNEVAQSLIVVESAPPPAAAPDDSDRLPLAWDEEDETRKLERPVTAALPTTRRKRSHPALALVDEAVARANDHAVTSGVEVMMAPVVALGPPLEPEPEPLRRRCHACGHALLPEEVFCGMCGARTKRGPSMAGDADLFEAERRDDDRCDACGHEIIEGTDYCVECGVFLGS
ncbi:MAG: protein phosphatase 2C domain-containing protein [Myxococcota bacterium]